MPPFSQTWLPFIYLYGVGGVFFILCMIVISRSKGLNLTRKRHRYWNKILYFGFFYFAFIHLVMILAALYL
ncbi:MAG: hypothetical protein V1773_17645 [bacterium]